MQTMTLTIHDINVQPIRAIRYRLRACLSECCEIRRKNRRGYDCFERHSGLSLTDEIVTLYDAVFSNMQL